MSISSRFLLIIFMGVLCFNAGAYANESLFYIQQQIAKNMQRMDKQAKQAIGLIEEQTELEERRNNAKKWQDKYLDSQPGMDRRYYLAKRVNSRMDAMHYELDVLDQAESLYGDMAGTIKALKQNVESASSSTNTFDIRKREKKLADVMRRNMKGAVNLKQMAKMVNEDSKGRSLAHLHRTSDALARQQSNQNLNTMAKLSGNLGYYESVVNSQISRIAIAKREMETEFNRLRMLDIQNNLHIVGGLVENVTADIPVFEDYLDSREENDQFLREAERREFREIQHSYEQGAGYSDADQQLLNTLDNL